MDIANAIKSRTEGIGKIHERRGHRTWAYEEEFSRQQNRGSGTLPEGTMCSKAHIL